MCIAPWVSNPTSMVWLFCFFLPQLQLTSAWHFIVPRLYLSLALWVSIANPPPVISSSRSKLRNITTNLFTEKNDATSSSIVAPGGDRGDLELGVPSSVDTIDWAAALEQACTPFTVLLLILMLTFILNCYCCCYCYPTVVYCYCTVAVLCNCLRTTGRSADRPSGRWGERLKASPPPPSCCVCRVLQRSMYHQEYVLYDT